MHHFCGSQYWKSAVFALGKMIFSGAHSIVTPYNRSECLQIHILSFFKGFSKAKIWCFNWFWCKKVCFESLNFDQITDLEAFGSVVGGHNWMRFFALGNWHHLENVPAPRTPPFAFSQNFDEILMKFWWNFDEICVGSFSAVSTNFWVLLSIPSTGGRDLAPYCKKWKNKFFFRGRKFWSKLHFSHFEWRFFIIFSSMLRKFWASRARWGRILTENEERIEKLVDPEENEPRQKCEFFDAFSNKENEVNLFRS